MGNRHKGVLFFPIPPFSCARPTTLPIGLHLPQLYLGQIPQLFRSLSMIAFQFLILKLFLWKFNSLVGSKLFFPPPSIGYSCEYSSLDWTNGAGTKECLHLLSLLSTLHVRCVWELGSCLLKGNLHSFRLPVSFVFFPHGNNGTPISIILDSTLPAYISRSVY